ncbi:MAG: hypothetical protein ABL921_23705 [Pirellula sp.]
MALISFPDSTSFADLLQQFVRANPRTNSFGVIERIGLAEFWLMRVHEDGDPRLVQQPVGAFSGTQESFDLESLSATFRKARA